MPRFWFGARENSMFLPRKEEIEVTARAGPSNWYVPKGIRFGIWSAFFRFTSLLLDTTPAVTLSLIHRHFSAVRQKILTDRGFAVSFSAMSQNILTDR